MKPNPDATPMPESLLTIYQELGIPPVYTSDCSMPLQQECLDLVLVEPDVFGRAARLESATAQAWQRMQQAALAETVMLQLVSAYRSYDYQKQIFQRKIARGDDITDILRVNAAPGYSEHHSGRALDLGCPDFPHLEESFENSPAFAWLVRHAPEFGFRLSFPRDNTHGVLYEPWHWYYTG